MKNLEHTQKTLEKFRDYVINEARKNLKKGGKYGSYNSTGNLSSSLTGNVKVSKNSFELDFDMPMYGQFQDKGVRGSNPSAIKNGVQKAPNSPFSFKKSMISTKALDSWSIKKGLAPRNKEGKFLSRESLKFALAKSIASQGLRPSLFFTKPFEQGYKKFIDDDLINEFALDVEDLIKFSLKDIK
jgi:hypothetical protein